MLHVEHEQNVERGQADAPEEREAEQELQGDRRAKHLGQVAGGDGDFAKDPQDQRRPARVRVAARLREVAAAGDAEARGERLQQDGHQVRQQDHAEQRVAEPSSAGDVGGPVARVHVAHGHEVAGPGEGRHLSPETARRRGQERCRGPPEG